MSHTKNPERRFPIKLTLSQRKAIAQLADEIIDRLKLDEQALRAIEFTQAELKAIHWMAKQEALHANSVRKRRTLVYVMDRIAVAFDAPADRPSPDIARQ
jgi:hypothetical protein